MKVTIIGTGYVGLVSGTCLAEFGFQVTCVDKIAEKIDKLNNSIMPIFEPGLKDLVVKNVAQGRLYFTKNLAKAVGLSDIILIAVGTPTGYSTGSADLRYVFEAAQEIAPLLQGYTVIVTKSTVPVGTTRQVRDTIRVAAPKADFDVASNPEFLREGAAIADFMNPERVVIGVESDRAKERMHTLYSSLSQREIPLVFTNFETAELSKYASNTFLATKIEFINQIADLAEVCGADVQHIAHIMGLDARIGKAFLQPGPGFGGSCFPKDTRALAAFAHERHVSVPLIDAVDSSNEARKKAMAKKIIAACGGSVRGKKLAILGLTFKANTDDMRESASLIILPILKEAGAVLSAFDPEADITQNIEFAGVERVPDIVTACQGADAIVILTEWDIFKALPFEKLAEVVKERLLIDLRNLYELDNVTKAKFSYVSLGRPTVQPKY
ncbi:MAG: UDP-glucose/GDP-mannose dehydrogenase family protein [Holosporales bacterium]|jgi:UDPglucose 6-dehydrogenase|nr:UDP-glucose/GDP-mannose dehydrogenase family protein [Holosporales bacterium]